MPTHFRPAIAALAAGIALAAIALTGCGGVADGGVAQVGDQVIPQSELDQALSQQKSAAEQQQQTVPAEGTDEYAALAQTALASLVFQRIVDQEAEKCGKSCMPTASQLKAETKKIEAYSDAWMTLLATSDDLARILALGERVVFLHQGTVYEVVPAAK